MTNNTQVLRFPIMRLGFADSESPIIPTAWTEDWLNIRSKTSHLSLRYERNSGTYVTLSGLLPETQVPFFQIQSTVSKDKLLRAGKGFYQPRFFSYDSRIYTGFQDLYPGIKRISEGQNISEITIQQNFDRGFDEVRFDFNGRKFAFGYDVGSLIAIELITPTKNTVLQVPGKDARHKHADISALAIGVSTEKAIVPINDAIHLTNGPLYLSGYRTQ
jgi:hypothetical protein